MIEHLIEARAYRIAFAFHCFWAIRDVHAEKVLAELHGLATSRVTGRSVPIGTTSEHSLRVHHFVHDPFYAASLGVPVRHTAMCFRSDARVMYRGTDALARWNVAVSAMVPLNQRDLGYPPYGFNMFGETVNSNSAYRTLGELMGVAIHVFRGGWKPGLKYRMADAGRLGVMISDHSHDVPPASGAS